MELYREFSQYHKSKLVWLWLPVIALALWLWLEMDAWFAGRPSFTGIAYIICLSGLLIWRYAVRYTYCLSKQQLVITSRFLCFERTFLLDLASIEGFSFVYVKSAAKRAGIRHYVYRYSSGDGNPTRIIVFNRGKGRQAVLFKVQEGFMDELKALIPGRLLEDEKRQGSCS